MFFGGLLVVLLCFAGFFAVTALLSTESGRRSYAVPGAFIGMVALLLLIGTKCVSSSDVEWDPVIRNDAAVTGTWKNETELLVLDADHTFRYRTAGQTWIGTWKRVDWNLTLSGKHFSGGMEFIRVRGQYRLLDASFDPDGWNDSLGLRQTQH